MSMLYLDNAATTPVRPEVLEAMMPYLTRWFGNPSSHHTVGEAAADALADARARVARVLGAARGRRRLHLRRHRGQQPRDQGHRDRRAARAATAGSFVTTPIEHESILESVDYLAAGARLRR